MFAYSKLLGLMQMGMLAANNGMRKFLKKYKNINNLSQIKTDMSRIEIIYYGTKNLSLTIFYL